VEKIIDAAEQLFGHVIEAENDVLLIMLFEGTFKSKTSKYMTVCGRQDKEAICRCHEEVSK